MTHQRLRWKTTDLTVTDAAGNAVASRQMADTDVEPFTFDAQQAVSAVSALLRNLRSGTEDGPVAVGGAAAGAIAAVALAGTIATVTLSGPAGLTRDEVYELSVVWTTAGGRSWTNTLVIECVA